MDGLCHGFVRSGLFWCVFFRFVLYLFVFPVVVLCV